MNHAGSSGPTNADASTFLPDSLDDDFYMDHPDPGPSVPIMMGEDLDEAYGQSNFMLFRCQINKNSYHLAQALPMPMQTF
jgi:hypothetical protein